jgi:hypothetical protein
MTPEKSLLLRGAISCTLGACSIASWKLAPRLRIADRSFPRLFLALFAASRLGLYTFALLILHMAPRGDIFMYMEEAAPALAGKLVYRDFPTQHAPLDPYMLSSMLRLHHSPLTIIFFAVCFDILAMFVWMKVAPVFLDSLTLRRAALLVLFNPTSLLSESIDGQMNSLIALTLALGVYFIYRNRGLLTGIAVALPNVIVKFLCLIYAPGYLFASRRKLVATAGFVGLILLVYVPFALIGADLTVPLHVEGSHITSSNAIYLVGFITGRDLGLRAPDAALALSWFFIVGLTFFCMRAVRSGSPDARRRTLYMLTISLIAELLCIQVFSKNSWDRYLVMAMFPLCTLVARMSFIEVVGFGLWAADVCFESSYWADNGMLFAPQVHAALLSHSHFALNLLLIEILQTAGSVLLWCACIRRLLALRSEPLIPAADPAGLDAGPLAA